MQATISHKLFRTILDSAGPQVLEVLNNITIADVQIQGGPDGLSLRNIKFFGLPPLEEGQTPELFHLEQVFDVEHNQLKYQIPVGTNPKFEVKADLYQNNEQLEVVSLRGVISKGHAVNSLNFMRPMLQKHIDYLK